MNRSHLFLLLSLVLAAFCSAPNADAQTDVVAFWGFADDFDFGDGADGPTMQDFAADVDNTVGINANLQQFRGDGGDIDDNGGGGFVSYTSQVSGANFGPSRTLRWTDLAGGGDDFSIGAQTLFDIDTNDGAGAVQDDFGNDALVYITLDGTGFQDFQIRFDAEGTPLDPEPDPGVAPESFLPESFDLFYRVGGSGTWFRDDDQNNIGLSFSDLDPANPDPENQVADSGFVTLNAALNNASQIEIIINDFDNGGNDELELDNFEIVANVVVPAVPEPGSGVLFFMAGLGLVASRRRK